MALEVKFTGGRELERALRTLPRRIEQKVARQALRQGAKVYQKALKTQLPRSIDEDKSFHLADSIKIVRPRQFRKNLFVRIGVAGRARTYAHIVEFGSSDNKAQPTWRPIFRRDAQRVIRTVAAKLGTDIIKEVRRGN